MPDVLSAEPLSLLEGDLAGESSTGRISGMCGPGASGHLLRTPDYDFQKLFRRGNGIQVKAAAWLRSERTSAYELPEEENYEGPES